MEEVTCWNFCFQLFPGAIRSRKIIEFLAHLLRHISRRPMKIHKNRGQGVYQSSTSPPFELTGCRHQWQRSLYFPVWCVKK
ncbi:MAG: hypothetical protein DMG69_28270 [Acidobacteria bacterium]|nr:MAG: hypothetical protein DMG69_28270 [Acidobacteriota bacterium]